MERLRQQAPGGTRYEVLDEIARGGMGIGLRVRDRQLRRRLAMKIVLAKDEALLAGHLICDRRPRVAPRPAGLSPGAV